MSHLCKHMKHKMTQHDVDKPVLVCHSNNKTLEHISASANQIYKLVTVILVQSLILVLHIIISESLKYKMVELNELLDSQNGTSNGKHATTYKLPSNIDGEQIVKVEIVEQIQICDALLSENGAFHFSQRTKCVVIPPIREILATEPYGKPCCCKSGIEQAHSPTFRPPLNTIRFAGDEPIPSNHIIIDLYSQVRDIYETARTSMQHLQDWITLRVPKVEDGNNFGVEVQEKCLSEATHCVTTIKSILVNLSMERYFSDRLDLFTLMCRYPQMDDAKQKYNEVDMNQFEYLRQAIMVLRDMLIGIHNNVSKNMTKVKEPKPKNDMFENYAE